MSFYASDILLEDRRSIIRDINTKINDNKSVPIHQKLSTDKNKNKIIHIVSYMDIANKKHFLTVKDHSVSKEIFEYQHPWLHFFSQLNNILVIKLLSR